MWCAFIRSESWLNSVTYCYMNEYSLNICVLSMDIFVCIQIIFLFLNFIFHLILFTFLRPKLCARSRPRIYPCIGFWSKQKHHAQRSMYVLIHTGVLLHFRSYYIFIITYYYFGLDLCVYRSYFLIFSMFSFIFTLFGCWNGGVCNTITLSVRICALSPLFYASRCLVRTGHLMKKCASEWRKVKET